MAEEKNGKIVSTGNTTCACGPGCTCGCGHYCMHRILWWIVGIVVLIIVFCIGVKAGEFSDALHSMYGGYYRGYPVMQYHEVYGGGGVVSPAQPETPTGIVTSTPGGPMIPAQQ
ncbi:MAG TPA: hypothetical protein VIJ29_03840 [Candidatus Paceibacterota bacterium]